MTPPDLKIIIAGTPKTGNTWLKYLLSAIYSLPVVDLPWSFDPAQLDALGERWIGQQHYGAVPEVMAWAQQRRVTLITTIRHPGDALVSFFHYIRSDPSVRSGVSEAAAAISLDGDQIGSHTLNFVETEFSNMLRYSLEWMRSGESLVVRYEDLWRDPQTVLSNLTAQIEPVTQDAVERAIEACEFGLMQAVYDHEVKFYRAGRVGDWRRELSAGILDRFRRVEPYPEQFAELGYSLDPCDPLVDAPRKPRESRIPFQNGKGFDNGVAAPPIIASSYLSVELCFERWPRPQELEGADSFFAWLNAPAEADPCKQAAPLITNLAAHLHRIDLGIQKDMPDLFGRDRLAFAYWFLAYVQDEYRIPDAFTDPIVRSSDRLFYLATKLDALAERTACIAQMEREWQGTQSYVRKLERTHPLWWLKKVVNLWRPGR